MKKYSPEIEQQMVHFYRSMSEKDRRRCAAVEAAKLGHGGIKYIADLFGCNRDTIRMGLQDLRELPEDAAEGRVRKRGAVARMLAADDPRS